MKSALVNLQTDLGATVEGRFSPEDWARIATRAATELDHVQARHPEWSEAEAWHEVMRDFRRAGAWGFRADYRPPKVKRKPSFGLSSLWVAFSSMTVTKVAVLWTGQIYSRSDDPRDKWTFLVVLTFWAMSFVYFIWKWRGYGDEPEV